MTTSKGALFAAALALVSGCDGEVGWVSTDGGAVTETGSSGDSGDSGDSGASSGEGSPGLDALKGCNPQTFTLEQAPPAEIYLTLDRSGSMSEQGSSASVTKWKELQGAVDFVLQQFESSIHFGLLTFPADSTCKTAGPQVKIGANSRAAVLNHLSKATPAGGTPTAAALNNAAQSLKDVGTTGATKYLILATDGGPNCNYLLSATPACSCTQAAAAHCCTNNPAACYAGHTCLDDTHTLQVIQGLYQKDKIVTFVIGLEGSAEYKTLLDMMAQAGGAPQTGGTTSYYPASSKTEIQAALKAIAVSVISCEIDLKKKPDYPDKVLVYLDGKLVPRDTAKQDGWDYPDSSLTKIKLYGGYCTTLQDGKKHSLTATFACVVN
jgi:von Willebrand factor type A domain